MNKFKSIGTFRSVRSYVRNFPPSRIKIKGFLKIPLHFIVYCIISFLIDYLFCQSKHGKL